MQQAAAAAAAAASSRNSNSRIGGVGRSVAVPQLLRCAHGGQDEFTLRTGASGRQKINEIYEQITKKKMSSRQRTNSTQEKAAVVGLVGVGENQFSDKTSVLSV